MSTFGTRARAARDVLGISGSELSRRSGVARDRISRIEHGHNMPSIETATELARALGVGLDFLCDTPHSDADVERIERRVAVLAQIEELRSQL